MLQAHKINNDIRHTHTHTELGVRKEKRSNNEETNNKTTKYQKEYDFFDEAIIKLILIDPINIKQKRRSEKTPI